jgi:hypothetical protein
MKRRHVLAGILGSLAVVGGSAMAQQAPAADAASPRLSVGAAHRWIAVSGYNFSRSGRSVSLDAYGLSGGNRVFLTSATVTPLRTAPQLRICLIGPLCYAGGFSDPNMRQGQDPCVRFGFSHIEVDAFTDDAKGNPYLAASATTIVTCPPPFKG